MTQHKTLADFCNEISQSKYKVNYESLKTNGIKIRILTEAAELYASQFIKKDDLEAYWKHRCKLDENVIEEKPRSWDEYIGFLAGATLPDLDIRNDKAAINKEVVSSDVVEDFKRFIKFLCGETDFDGVWFGEYNGQSPFWWRTKLREFENIFQSTQQPATINFFSDDELKDMCPHKDFSSRKSEWMATARVIQSKLKERVNCVDPWISVNDRLPELEQEVLSFSPNEGIRQTKYTTYQEGSTGHSQGDKDCWFEWATHNNFAWKHRATHWMPLINSPKTTPNGQAE